MSGNSYGLTAAEAAVLLAVASGATSVDEVAELLNVSRRDVEGIVERLVSMGYLAWERGRGLLRWRRRLRLTEKGLETLPEARRLLEHVAETVKRSLRERRLARPGGEHGRLSGSGRGNPGGADLAAAVGLGAAALPLLPMLLGLGLLDAALLAATGVLEGFEEDEESGESGEHGFGGFDVEEWE